MRSCTLCSDLRIWSGLEDLGQGLINASAGLGAVPNAGPLQTYYQLAG